MALEGEIDMKKFKKAVLASAAAVMLLTMSVSAAESTQNGGAQDGAIIIDPAAASAADARKLSEKNEEYLKAQKNVILEDRQTDGDTAVDLSTIDKIYERADVIAVGTVRTVGMARYRDGRFYPYTAVEFSCENLLKGAANKELTFSFLGGYMSAEQYFQRRAEKSSRKPYSSGFSDDEIEGGYIHSTMYGRPEPQPGVRYAVFLQREKNGELTAMGSSYSILTADGDKYTDYEGKTQVIPVVSQPTAIEVASTKDKTAIWSAGDAETIKRLNALLMSKDEKYGNIDISPNDFTVTITRDGKKSTHRLWLDFGDDSAAIMQLAEGQPSQTEDYGMVWKYWSVPAEESKALREVLKKLSPIQ